MSVCNAKKVEIELTTAPSMMPTMGTTRLDFKVTRRKNRKNTAVPMKAKIIAPLIRPSNDAEGKKYITKIRPSPAHSVVPVVVGSTNLLCVSSCMTRPHIAIAAPESTSAMVRGIRVVANISQPSSAPRMSYWPTNSDIATRTATTAIPMANRGSSNFCIELVRYSCDWSENY